jgi:zinc protease
MLNRKKQPTIHEVTKLTLPKTELFYLDNQIPVYVINAGLQDVVKIEVVFRAGRPFEKKPLASRATASLLKDGTASYSSAEIAEKIDFYGGTLTTPFNIDTSNIVLQCLGKHFEQLLPILAEVIQVPTFDQKELDTFIQNNISNLNVELSKNEVLAYREFTESIFTSKHAYGYNTVEKMYRNLRREQLVEHHEENFHAGNCSIFLSGKITEQTLNLVNQHLGKLVKKEQNTFVAPQIKVKPKTIKIDKKDSSQTAIMLGKRIITRKHEDYTTFFVLNTILGGYFGSRLMENIREKNGYTYNIYSSIESMLYDGYFHISTEVGNEYLELTRQEIFKEIEILQTELVSEIELKMVQNYLLGNILTMIDGPFNVAEIVKGYVTEDIELERFERIVDDIRRITPQDLKNCAIKYLAKKDFTEVIVG